MSIDVDSGLRIGVDTGGTFTDFAVVDAAGDVFQFKQDSTPDEPNRAVTEGLREVAKRLSLSTEDLLKRTELFVHGTTVATNAVIQRKGPQVGLICTKGFRDILYFRDGYKEDRFNIHMSHPGEFVPRRLRIGVSERIMADGTVHEELSETDVREAARRFREAGVGAVAVSLLWSIMNPEHELAVQEILAEEMPGVPVLLSHKVLQESREWQRTSATVLSAFIAPLIDRYLSGLKAELKEMGLEKPPLIMQINGGCGTVEDILEQPINVLHSGPAAAPAAVAWLSSQSSETAAITVDMGGTSLDVCMIENGEAGRSRQLQVEGQPIGVSGVEVQSIGAGGGSIGWIDSGGALRVGPRSAGADPGPACYGRQSEMATVTDANVVLGYLDPGAFLGGRRSLDAEASLNALAGLGEKLGLNPHQAAEGVIRIVNANMVGAIRGVSVERGIDPRNFIMICGGGAGGLHGVEIAREIGISRVLIPAQAGTLCAFGMAVTDVRQERTGALHAVSDEFDREAVEELLARLEEEGRQALRRAGFSDSEIRVEYATDARYPGQVHELLVPLPGATLDAGQLKQAEELFHSEHRRKFTYSRPELPIEFLHWRVAVIGQHQTPLASGGFTQPQRPATPGGQREIWVAGDWVPAAVFDMDALEPGMTITGPAVIEASTTTVLLPKAGDQLTVRDDGAMLIQVAREQ